MSAEQGKVSLRDVGERLIIAKTFYEQENNDWSGHLNQVYDVPQEIVDMVETRLRELGDALVQVVVNAIVESEDGHRAIDEAVKYTMPGHQNPVDLTGQTG